MAVNLSPIWGAGAQLLDNSGNVLSGGKIYTYAAGTTTQVTTYTSNTGVTANSNPIVLNSAGRVPYEIWLTDGQNYKFVLKDSNDVLIGTWDNLSGINSNFVAYTNQQEIQTATAGQTVFNLTTMQYLPGTGNLSVFVDGVNQYGPGAQYAFEETDQTTVTFASGLHVGASVKFTSTQIQNAGVADASQVSYTYPDANAVTQNVEERLAQYVSVKDFGAVGDGVADDTDAIQNAIDSLGTAGGTVAFTHGEKYYIASDLTVPNLVTLQGPYGNVGERPAQSGTDFYDLASIRLDPAATINLSSGAGIVGMLIINSDITAYPTTVDPDTWTGTAITGIGNDYFVFNSMILCFAQAIYSTGVERATIEKVNIDCRSGVWIDNATDVCLVNNVRCWPFATVDGDPNLGNRDGVAYKTTTNADLTKFTNCFSWGYIEGFEINGCNGVVLVNCSADHDQNNNANSYGFMLLNDCTNVKFVGCSSSGKNRNYYVDLTGTANHVSFVDCSSFVATAAGLVISSGNVNVESCEFYYTPLAIQIGSATSKVFVDSCYFYGITTLPIQLTQTNNSVYIGNQNDYGDWVNGSSVTNNSLNIPKTIASASPLVLPANGSVFNISGTTNFSLVNSGWNGRTVTLLFGGVLTITGSGVTNGIHLNGGTYTTAAGNSLTIVHDGSQWWEIGRG